MTKANFGVVGLAVMGKNLALNIESRGYRVALFNRTSSVTEKIATQYSTKKFVPTYDIEEFVNAIEKPRRILLMVKAGTATDATIQQLLPYLDKGDILIDGGNTFFQDTIRRNQELDASGINFIGTGISGGEEGALNGPSIMPGGQKAAYKLVEPILKEIAAKAKDKTPCVTYIGPNGAGHYVKMVHNGIEYGDMQLIAESYALLKQLLHLKHLNISEIFAKWNKGELDSYLIEITADILNRKDDKETDAPIVDVILDAAGNKGTGKWTSQSALDLGVPLPLITESVFARYLSACKEERIKASKILTGPNPLHHVTENKAAFIEKIRQALYFAKIMSYAQGFAQLRVASKEYKWQLPFGKIAQIWRAGCIIRAQFLQKITDAYQTNPELDNLLLDNYFKEITQNYQQAIRDVVSEAIKAGIPVPTFASAIAYFDSYRSEKLPANLIQAQRDYFGAHTYKRVDKAGDFHYPWHDQTKNS